MRHARIAALAVLITVGLGLAGCQQQVRTLPGTPSCGVDCRETCWPCGRIGPVCPELCEEYAEPGCPPCLPGKRGAYAGPVAGKHQS